MPQGLTLPEVRKAVAELDGMADVTVQVRLAFPLAAQLIACMIICLPVAIPPAAITGIFTASATAGINTMVVVSSLPLCPPASKPSATTASQPESSAFFANLLLLTT